MLEFPQKMRLRLVTGDQNILFGVRHSCVISTAPFVRRISGEYSIYQADVTVISLRPC